LIISNTMNIIGESQDPEKFFPKTLKNVLAGTEMTIHAAPNGDIGSRFYLHARNQADGLLFLLKHFTINEKYKGQGVKLAGSIPPDTEEFETLRYSWGGTVPPRYHIVGEREVDNLEMAQLIAQAAGKELKYKLEDFHSSRPGHDLRYALDGRKIASIGWTAPVPLETSIKSTVDWTLSHPEWLAL
jgi:dTDP-glucose 4,6-dehydratase